MPRGNDSEAALAELRGKYGETANATSVIDAQRAAYPRELRAAQLQPLDQEATDALDLDAVNQKVEDAFVISASVRGEWVVYVAETDSGRTFKGVIPHVDLGGAKPRRSVRPVFEQTEEEKAQVEKVLADLKAAQIAAEELDLSSSPAEKSDDAPAAVSRRAPAGEPKKRTRRAAKPKADK